MFLLQYVQRIYTNALLILVLIIYASHVIIILIVSIIHLINPQIICIITML